MKRRIPMIVPCLSLVFASYAAVPAQHEHHGQMNQQTHGSMDMSTMMKEPHHVLAMAYMQNLATFSKALREQVDSTKTVDAEFARTAVGEMRRSFDAMQQQAADHMKSMPADMKSHMSTMMQGMESHMAAIKQSLAALEREIQAGTPSATKVSTSAGEIVSNIDQMGHSRGEHKM